MRAQAWIWIVSMASTFAFLSVFWWALQRRREREAYYRFDLARQLAARASEEEQPKFLDWLREQDVRDAERRREGLKVTAFVLVAVGCGFLLAFGLHTEEAGMGWCTIFSGLALFLYLGTNRYRR